jgi:predicted AAA+ superfamily ATPase
LLGRIKDRHLLPFSFREYADLKLRDRAPEFVSALERCPSLRDPLLAGDAEAAERIARDVQVLFAPFTDELNEIVREFCAEGGFPEVWALSDPVRKIEYLMEQQVRKVLFEDLTQIAEYRKPENVLRLFLYLLAHPGVELNVSKVSKEAQLERRVIDENLPRLELTDLVVRIHKFRHQALRVRASNVKCYPTDLALRNAVLKTWGPPDSQTMGYYAEGLVVRTLLEWREILELSYYREDRNEIDFVVTHGGARHLPIEVKQRNQSVSFASLKAFARNYDVPVALGITRTLEVTREDKILRVPLRYFLLST